VLRFGVLGLLIERRGYGYELVQRLAARLGVAWQLNPSAVYTALDQLEAGGLIEPVVGADTATARARAGGGGCATEVSGGREPGAGGEVRGPAGVRERRVSRRGARVVYRATERGKAEFDAWLACPSARLEPIRSELALKVAMANPERAPALLATIAHEEQLIVNSSAQSRAVGDTQFGRLRIAGQAEERGDARGPLAATLVGAEAALRTQCELEWLAVVREALQRMQGEAVATGATGAQAPLARVARA
jgi:DNA-binding PadR family transcriptional regulator